MKKSTTLLLWIGAAISISEIFTGGLIAPLGLLKGFVVIVIGHIIGVSLLAFGGYVSFSRRKNAMESVNFSFGRGGGKIVAVCNVVQLIGWTIIMVVQAGSAIISVFPNLPFAPVALVLAVLVLVWALVFGSPAGRINDVGVVLLSVLCIVLFVTAKSGGVPAGFISGNMSTVLAIELSIAMPISWLPLIGDYSSEAKSGMGAAGVPFIGYFIASTLMYLFGLFIGVSTGGDIFSFVAGSRFPYLACGVVLLSTLTTAFLDLYSAAVSSGQIVKVKNRRISILVIGVFAAGISVLFPVEQYSGILTAFLTSIGMVFVPVYTVLFLDFIMKKKEYTRLFHVPKLLIALLGMIGYSFFSSREVWIPTVMSVLLVSVLYFIYALVFERKASALRL